jgi:HK97 gp10 family phage protein
VPVVATFRIEGLSELLAALEELPKATGKNVIRRILKKRAQPIADDAEARAPVYAGPPRKIKNKRTGKEITLRPGALKKSVKVGSKLSRRQRKAAADTKSYTEIYIGPAPLPQATLQEFGTSKDRPQPFMRPAWDAHKGTLLNGLKDDLWDEISRAAARLARKTAKAKG